MAIPVTPATPRVLRASAGDQQISKNKKIEEQALDNLLDSLVWMRRNAKKRKDIDDLIDVMIKVRRKAKKKATKQTGKRTGRRLPKTQ